jgi:hypothetical protein
VLGLGVGIVSLELEEPNNNPNSNLDMLCGDMPKSLYKVLLPGDPGSPWPVRVTVEAKFRSRDRVRNKVKFMVRI